MVRGDSDLKDELRGVVVDNDRPLLFEGGSD